MLQKISSKTKNKQVTMNMKKNQIIYLYLQVKIISNREKNLLQKNANSLIYFSCDNDLYDTHDVQLITLCCVSLYHIT